jgi:hypothetical protein
MLELNKNYFADNRDILKTIPDKSINLFLEDMPYNTTACDWEYEVDLKEYWELRLPKLADNVTCQHGRTFESQQKRLLIVRSCLKCRQC